jgi:hypothetical protein
MVWLVYTICDELSGSEADSASSTSILPYKTAFHQNPISPIPEMYVMICLAKHAA